MRHRLAAIPPPAADSFESDQTLEDESVPEFDGKGVKVSFGKY